MNQGAERPAFQAVHKKRSLPTAFASEIEGEIPDRISASKLLISSILFQREIVKRNKSGIAAIEPYQDISTPLSHPEASDALQIKISPTFNTHRLRYLIVVQ